MRISCLFFIFVLLIPHNQNCENKYITKKDIYVALITFAVLSAGFLSYCYLSDLLHNPLDDEVILLGGEIPEKNEENENDDDVCSIDLLFDDDENKNLAKIVFDQYKKWQARYNEKEITEVDFSSIDLLFKDKFFIKNTLTFHHLLVTEGDDSFWIWKTKQSVRIAFIKLYFYWYKLKKEKNELFEHNTDVLSHFFKFCVERPLLLIFNDSEKSKKKEDKYEKNFSLEAIFALLEQLSLEKEDYFIILTHNFQDFFHFLVVEQEQKMRCRKRIVMNVFFHLLDKSIQFPALKDFIKSKTEKYICKSNYFSSPSDRLSKIVYDKDMVVWLILLFQKYDIHFNKDLLPNYYNILSSISESEVYFENFMKSPEFDSIKEDSWIFQHKDFLFKIENMHFKSFEGCHELSIKDMINLQINFVNDFKAWEYGYLPFIFSYSKLCQSKSLIELYSEYFFVFAIEYEKIPWFYRKEIAFKSIKNFLSYRFPIDFTYEDQNQVGNVFYHIATVGNLELFKAIEENYAHDGLFKEALNKDFSKKYNVKSNVTMEQKFSTPISMAEQQAGDTIAGQELYRLMKKYEYKKLSIN